jgi:hypothetical protein
MASINNEVRRIEGLIKNREKRIPELENDLDTFRYLITNVIRAPHLTFEEYMKQVEHLDKKNK